MRLLAVSLVVFVLNLPFTTAVAIADTYHICVQPVLPSKEIKKNYQVLADYLSKNTEHNFVITSYRNFFTYWAKMQRAKKMDFILDAAHFTDYRVQKKNYKVLAKLPDTVSLSVVTSEDTFIFEMDELVSKRVATMASPGMGGVRLNQMFPNPVQLPIFVEASNSVEAANMVLDGKADAAIIPSPLVGNFPGLNMVTTTEPVPHMAMSASPEVPAAVRNQVKKLLIEAKNTEEGKKMLADLNLPEFVNTDEKTYSGYAKLLEDVWGY